MTASTYSIKQAAEAAGLTTKTIRYYEQEGFIPRAARINRAARTGGNRAYKDADIERLRFVRNARLLGLGLGEIRDLLAASEGRCPGDDPLYAETLAGHLERIEEGIARLRALRDAVQRLVARAQSGTGGCSDSGCGCMDVPELRARFSARLTTLGEKAALRTKTNGKEGNS